MADLSIRHEFDSCVHVAVSGADKLSERSRVQLSRNYASQHYGRVVGHWVSAGWSDGAYTYVYSKPDSTAREVAPKRTRAARS